MSERAGRKSALKRVQSTKEKVQRDRYSKTHLELSSSHRHVHKVLSSASEENWKERRGRKKNGGQRNETRRELELKRTYRRR